MLDTSPLGSQNGLLYLFIFLQILRQIGVNADENAVRWKACYQKLYKRYGRKELYGDMLHICGHCNCLYWKVSRQQRLQYKYLFGNQYVVHV